MNCRICGRFLPSNDSIAFLDGLAHVFCVARAQLTGRIGSKILVLVRRKGFTQKTAQ